MLAQGEEMLLLSPHAQSPTHRQMKIFLLQFDTSIQDLSPDCETQHPGYESCKVNSELVRSPKFSSRLQE